MDGSRGTRSTRCSPVSFSRADRAKLGSIGKNSLHSKSFEISNYAPTDNFITSAEYPSYVPDQTSSRRYNQFQRTCSGIKEESFDFSLSDIPVSEARMSINSDSTTPLLNFSNLNSQYNESLHSYSPPNFSSSGQSDENLGDSANSVYHENTNFHLRVNNESIGRVSPGRTSNYECYRSPDILPRTLSNESINYCGHTNTSTLPKHENQCPVQNMP